MASSILLREKSAVRGNSGEEIDSSQLEQLLELLDARHVTTKLNLAVITQEYTILHRKGRRENTLRPNSCALSPLWQN
jgi:hypothetical protein